MRFGHWRGVTLAIALISSMVCARSASADGFHKTLPPEILARDLNTGGPYFAPPVPWGHYAKDGLFDSFYGKPCGVCGLLKGKGAGFCGGHGLLGGKGGCGPGGCGKAGCGLFGHGGGCGLSNHGGSGGGCNDPGCGAGHGRRVKDCGLCKGKGCGLCRSSGAGEPIYAQASSQSAPSRVVVTSPQAVPVGSPQGCAEPGCKLGRGHHDGDPCNSCGGKGCGLCGGLGKLFGHGGGGGGGSGDACGSCGGKGCGLCGGLGRIFGRGNQGCDSCGGRGCNKCGLGGGHIKGKLSGLLHPHKGNIKYFVGPGGPVPLTPGYVPYVVPTRSPRDFLAFPPYTPDGF